LQHEAEHRLKLASVGHNEGKTLSSLRGDSTLWLDDARCGEASKSFLLALEALRESLSRSMMLGLETVEAHFAVYPEGAAYARHRDRFRDDDLRILSLVCYLNADWPDDAGGAIRLHLDEGMHDIQPRMGTSIIFLSEEMDHEVLPSTQTRYSIAAWFHRREIQLR
ncbi:MAG: 2OG-Fe(II) oxygenase, partial [Arenimonas sp.]